MKDMKVCRNGITRIVFLIGNIAIKIPNFMYSHNHFLKGCVANWSERKYYKTISSLPDWKDRICPTLFCSWFGLISIQMRALPMERNLTMDEVVKFTNITADIKKQNFGWLNGDLVCIDYAD